MSPFTTAPKNIKYLGIILTKDGQALYIENYKTSQREIKEDLTRWKEKPSSGTGSLHFVKMIILSKLIYRFKATPIKISRNFFCKK